MARLKPLLDRHLADINTFWERDWSEYTLPDRRSSIIDSVVEDSNGKAIAYGQVKMFAEMMLFTDMQASIRDRAQAVKLLMFEGFRGIDESNLSDVYCIIKDMRFARLIAKRYGFHLVQDPGILLVKDMRG